MLKKKIITNINKDPNTKKDANTNTDTNTNMNTGRASYWKGTMSGRGGGGWGTP